MVMISFRLKLAYLTLTLLTLGGCGEKLNPAAVDLDCMGEICMAAAPQLTITNPGAAMTYTNKDLPIQVAVTPMADAPAKVELLKDGAHLADLSAPFSFTWIIAQEVDATYKLRARATIKGQMVMSQEITVKVDRMPPTMQSLPAAGATNVALSDPICVTFSEPVKAGTVPSNALTMTDAVSMVGLNAISRLSADGTVLTVEMWDRSELSFPATIKESMAATITDLAGNALTATPPWTWQAPLWVQMPALKGAYPYLGLDDVGQPTIAYVRPDPTTSSLSPGVMGLARYAPGATWDTTLPTASTASVYDNKLAIDPMNRPVVAWSEQNHIRVARLSGSTWEQIGGDADAGLGNSDPKGVASLALDAAGTPTVGIWDYAIQMAPPVGYVARSNGASWQVLNVGMSFPTNNGGGPLIAIDGTGAPLVWSSRTLQRLMGTTWTAIDLGTMYTFPTLALDALDRPIVAVEQNEGTTLTLDVRVWVQNVAWQGIGSSPLGSNSGGFTEVNVATGSDGTPFIAWELSGTGAAVDVRLAHWTGQAWISPYGSLNAVTGQRPAHVQLAIDAHGSPVVAFDEVDASNTTTSVYVWKSNL